MLSKERDGATPTEVTTGFDVSNIPCMHVYTGPVVTFSGFVFVLSRACH